MTTSPLRLFRLAFRAYARAPQERTLWPAAHADLGRAMRHLPLVGLLVGMLFSVVYVIVAQILPHSIAVLIALGVAALTTGAHHEIGWMRWCQTARREGDVHPAPVRSAGATGVVAMVFIAMLKLEALSSLDPSWISVAALTGQPLSRGLAVAALTCLARHPRGPAVLPSTWMLALLLSLVPAIAAAWWLENELAFACAMLPALPMLMVVRHLSRRRPAADSQAVLGATQQLTELAWYLGLLAWWSLAAAPATETPIE